MIENHLTLLGHDNPLGYPAPIVPIGYFYERFVAVYASDRFTVVDLDETSIDYIRHSSKLIDLYKHLDFKNERLFGLDQENIEKYNIDEESNYFRYLLSNNSFANNNVFMRFSLAKATKERDLTFREMFICALELNKTNTKFVQNWYVRQCQTVNNGIWRLFLPDNWEELELFLVPEDKEIVKSFYPEFSFLGSNQIEKNTLPERKELESMSDDDLFSSFLEFREDSPSISAEYFEALYERIKLYIAKRIRRSRLELEIDDITQKVFLRILSHLDEAKKHKFNFFLKHIIDIEITKSMRQDIHSREIFHEMIEGEDLEDSNSLKFEKEFLARENADSIRKIIESLALDTLDRSILEIFMSVDFNEREIAHRLGVNLTLLRSRLNNILRRMRRMRSMKDAL